MLKAILAGTTALVIAGSSLVYAQQRRSGPSKDAGSRISRTCARSRRRGWARSRPGSC